MSPGFRHIEKGVVSRYNGSIVVRVYPTGERRMVIDPPKDLLTEAFNELGTRNAVASAFGVSRDVVRRWERDSGLKFESRPEAGLSSLIKRRLGDVEKCKVAQWLMDEGSVSVTYFRMGDRTMLLVCGSMNDYSVLGSIAKILDVPITSSRAPGLTTLPMGGIRVGSARAYALLDAILPNLLGLKAMEARAALDFFPTSGNLRGRHTTEEFLLPVWKIFALDALNGWNARRRAKLDPDEIATRAQKWVEGRIRRARRFIDGPSREPQGATTLKGQGD